MKELKVAVNKVQFHLDIYPHILQTRDNFPTWPKRAAGLNKTGRKSYLGRDWNARSLKRQYDKYRNLAETRELLETIKVTLKYIEALLTAAEKPRG